MDALGGERLRQAHRLHRLKRTTLDGSDSETEAGEVNRSDAVRDFYERMPYPAPLTNLDKHRDLYKSPARRRALFHLIWPAERQRAIGEILIAGCGTSQAARYALREPEARITAIDISETSLDTRASFKSATNWKTSSSGNFRSSASASWDAASTSSSAPACSITFPIRTPVFAPFAMCFVQTARCT